MAPEETQNFFQIRVFSLRLIMFNKFGKIMFLIAQWLLQIPDFREVNYEHLILKRRFDHRDASGSCLTTIFYLATIAKYKIVKQPLLKGLGHQKNSKNL